MTSQKFSVIFEDLDAFELEHISHMFMTYDSKREQDKMKHMCDKTIAPDKLQSYLDWEDAHCDWVKAIHAKMQSQRI